MTINSKVIGTLTGVALAANVASASASDLEFIAGSVYELNSNQIVSSIRADIPIIESADGSYATDQIICDVNVTTPLDEGTEPTSTVDASVLYTKDLWALTAWGPYIRGAAGIEVGTFADKTKISGVGSLSLVAPMSTETIIEAYLRAANDEPERPAVVMGTRVGWDNGKFKVGGEFTMGYEGTQTNALNTGLNVSAGVNIGNNNWVMIGYKSVEEMNEGLGIYETNSGPYVGLGVSFPNSFQDDERK